MTCVAWDGRTLAADKRCTLGCQIVAVSKLERHEGHLLCASGCSSMGREVNAGCGNGVDWMRLDGTRSFAAPLPYDPR